mgnify:CR=1 FL=1
MQWLLDNYEIADGESLPRSTVYNHYLAHCRQMQLASVNAASFGKLIRSVFIGLKTRRLGTRGHSKYHYFGVRAKQHIQRELLQHQEGASCSRDNDNSSNHNTDNGSESDSLGAGQDCGRLSSGSSQKRAKQTSPGHHLRRNQQAYQQDFGPIHEQPVNQAGPVQQQQHELGINLNGVYYASGGNNNNEVNGYTDAIGPAAKRLNSEVGHTMSMDQTHCELIDFRSHLGANWTTLVDEHWPQREASMLERQLVTGQSDLAELVELFEAKYKSYYKRMVELLSELKFEEVEQLWREFWHPNDDTKQWTSHPHPTNGISQQLTNGQQLQPISEASHHHQRQHHVEYHHHHQHQHHQQPQPRPQPQTNIGGNSGNLTFHHLYQLTSQPMIVERINQIDYILYEAIESFLLPDMLSPIPRPLAQLIRSFAKNFAPWIELAVKDYDAIFVAEKSKSARAFGHALRRYTSLNHLSTASRAIWEKRSSLAQMSIDLSRVDLRDIEHQVSLMSHSSGSRNAKRNETKTAHLLNSAELQSATNSIDPNNDLNDQQMDNNENNLNDHQHRNHHPHHLCAMQPGQLIQNFLHLLEDPYPANSWPDWCRNLVESRVCGLSIEEARNFVLKWNFYISLIMKELTLKSAPSFGSFQLIRLLFDEYIFYLVVTRLAQAQHKTPAELLSL